MFMQVLENDFLPNPPTSLSNFSNIDWYPDEANQACSKEKMWVWKAT